MKRLLVAALASLAMLSFARADEEVVEPAKVAKVTVGEVVTEYADLHEALVAGSAAGSVVELIADVDLSDVAWEPITDFSGTFDGKGYTISNLSITKESGDKVGLIANTKKPEYSSPRPVIKNFVIEGISIKASNSQFVGGILGQGYPALITNVTLRGNIQIAGKKYVGGIDGHPNSTMIDCKVIGDGAATSFIGTANAAQVGGIYGMGPATESTKAYNCLIEKITILGNEHVGGIGGRAQGDVINVNCKVKDVIVKGGTNVGALIGQPYGYKAADGGGHTCVNYLMNCTADNVALQDADGNEIAYAEYGSTYGSADNLNFVKSPDADGAGVAAPVDKLGLTAGTFTVISEWKDKPGQVGVNLAAQCAAGYEPVANGDGTYTITFVPPVAKIGDKTYTSLAAAFADVKAGEKIELLNDAEIGDAVTLNKAITLDLGGFKLTRAAGKSSYMFTINAKVDIVNGEIDGGAASVVCVNNVGDLLFDNIEITSAERYFLESYGTMTIGTNAVVSSTVDIGYMDGGEVNIYGKMTTINGFNEKGQQKEYPVFWIDDGELNVYEGAELTCNAYVIASNAKAGYINIYGGTLTSQGYTILHCYTDSTATVTVRGGVFNGSAFGFDEDITVTPLDGTCKAKFSKSNGLADYCAAGYGLKKDGDWYVIAELPTVEAVCVGGKGTLTVAGAGEKVAFGSKISGTVAANDGYVPFVFVDGVKVAVNPETGAFEGVANNTAKVVATFAKEGAWYLDPFIRNSFTVKSTYSPLGMIMDADERFVAQNGDPGSDNYGLALLDAQSMKTSVNPNFPKLWDRGAAPDPNHSSYRQMALSDTYQAVFGCPWYASDNAVYIVPFDEAKPFSAVQINWGESENLSAKMYWGFALGDYIYYKHGNNNDIYKFSVVTDESGAVSAINAAGTVGSGAGAPIGKIVDGVPYAYTFNNTSIQVVNLEDGSVITNAIDEIAFGSARRTQLTGFADGVPHVIVHGDEYIAVYALGTDKLHLAAPTPIAQFKTGATAADNMFNCDATYAATTAYDDESELVFCNRSGKFMIFEKKPAKLIVRGTFSDEANAEDDVLVDFGGEANVQFAAPADKKIVGVKVNGVADASFTDAAYTFTDAALTKNVYIEMTTEDLPVAQIGTTTYQTLNAAFAAAQAGDTVELLRDAAVDATIVPTVAVTLDLAGKTLSSAGAETIFDTAVALTITNGVASLGTAMFINMTDGANVAVNDVVVSGSSDPIFYAAVGGSKTLTIGKGTVVTVAGNSWFDFRDTTLNLYGSVTNAPGGNGAACWPCAGTNVVNVYEGASLTSEREDFFRNNRGQVTYNIYGGTFYCPHDAIFYSYYKAKNGTLSPVFNIYGGTFESATFYKTTTEAEFVEPIVTALDDTCLAKFKSNGFGAGYTLADFCASGFEPVKGEDGYYTIQKKSAPTWPDDWSDIDADDAVKAKFADWRADPEKGASADLSTDAAKNAFLLNVAVDDIKELKIESIDVDADGYATIVVGMPGMYGFNVDLGEINGILSVEAGETLEGMAPKAITYWTTTGGKANIKVKANFIKVVIGFKTPAEDAVQPTSAE